MYEVRPSPGFGAGLNLRDKVDAVGQDEAIDLLNVYFTPASAVISRPGYSQFTSSALTNRVDSLSAFYTSGGTQHLIAGCGTRLEALNTSGAVVASGSDTGLTTGIWDFARFGAPGSEVIYAGNGKNLLQKWTGTAWSAVSNSPKARYLAVQAVDQGNRLVAGGTDDSGTAGPNGAQTYTSRVWFSNPGLPETWSANDYVDFSPGDGELIQSVVTWREFVFVFKESKFFVVYGTSTDPAGQPIFNWRPVDAGIGLASPRAVAVHRDGVYFLSRYGIYRTNGSEPELLSSNIGPIFDGTAQSFYLGGSLALSSVTNCSAGTWNERVYFAFPTSSTNNRVLVYDPRYEWWSLYDIPASCFAVYRSSATDDLYFGYASGSNHVGKHSLTATSDAGAAISSRWRSGWFDYEIPQVKTIRESKAWGTGKVFMGLSKDFDAPYGNLDLMDFTDPTAPTWGGTTWGGSTWAAPKGLVGKLRRRAIRGTVFSTYFQQAILNQPWSVSRLSHHLREVRVPSVVTA